MIDKWVSLYATGNNWGSAIRACSKCKIWTFVNEWHFLCRNRSCEAPKVGEQPLISSIFRGGPYSNYNIDMIDKRVFIYTTGGNWGSAIWACSKCKFWAFLIEWPFICRKGSSEAPNVGEQPTVSEWCTFGPYSNYNIDMIQICNLWSMVLL